MPEVTYHCTDDQYDPWDGDQYYSLEEAKEAARDKARENEHRAYFVVKVKVIPLYSVICAMAEEDLEEDDD